MALLVSILLAGALGFHRIEGWGWFDSFYIALITLTTVCDNEVLPLSQSGRIFNSALMLSGVMVVFTSIGILADTLVKLELADYFGRRRRVRMLSGLSNNFSSVGLAVWGASWRNCFGIMSRSS